MAVGARALRAGKGIIELSLVTGNVEKGLKKLENRMRNFGKSLTSIGSMGLKFSSAIGGMLAIPVKLAADFEKTRAEFQAMIGDAEKANKILAQMQQFALKSPLGMGELSEAARVMISFGVAVDEVVPTLMRLGEIAAGDGERMGRLALAFGQVTAKGRLMAQEVNQMVEAGFNPLQEISRTTGESMQSLMKRMEAGQLSVTEVAEAFKTATGAGGRFNGLLAKIAGTTIGKINELKESFFLAIRPLGEALLPMVKDFIEDLQRLIPRLTEWIKNNTALIKDTAALAIKVAAVSAALIVLGNAANVAAKAIGALRIAFMFLSKHPIVAAIVAIVSAIGILIDKLKEAKSEGEKFNKAMGDIRKKHLAKPGQGTGSLAALDAEVMRANPNFGKPAPGTAGTRLWEKNPQLLSLTNDDPFFGVERRGDQKRELNGAFVGGILNKFRDVMADAQVKAQAKIMRAQFELQDPMARIREAMDRMKEVRTDMATRRDGIFSTRFAAQVFGGRDRQVELLEGIKRNTDPRNQQNAAGGIAVV